MVFVIIVLPGHISDRGLARSYPKVGGRHDAAFVLAGFLARCGLSPPRAAVFVEAVAAASLQPGDKRRDMARTARDGANADKRSTVITQRIPYRRLAR
jgi:hypothetical protein